MTTSVQASPSVPPPGPPRRGLPLAAVVALALLLVTALVAAVVLIRGTSADSGSGPAGAVGPTAAPTPVPPTSPSATPPSSTGTASTTERPPSTAFRFVPLWPFTSVADAMAWQRAAGSGGRQPWRLDAASTAVAFASTYLRYGEIDRALSIRINGDQAWVGVGSAALEGRPVAAAVLHLARIGAGPLATRPWEVVGSEDTTLTLTRPAYGATVGAALAVGGTISGVDEALSVQVRSLSKGLLGRVTGVPAGGLNQPWRVDLVITSTTGPATIAVATGGHLRAVERFAITAVRLRPGSPVTTGYATADAALAATVAHGTYVGDCEPPAVTNPASPPVCSVLLKQHGDRYLYRVGYRQTDVGYFVILRRTASGSWVIVDGDVPGAHVPADLGGPIPAT